MQDAKWWQVELTSNGDPVTDVQTARRALEEMDLANAPIEFEDEANGIWLVEIPDGLMSEWILEDTSTGLGEVEVMGGEFEMRIPLQAR